MFQKVFFMVCFISLGGNPGKTYVKDYYGNGNIKAEGWIIKKLVAVLQPKGAD